MELLGFLLGPFQNAPHFLPDSRQVQSSAPRETLEKEKQPFMGLGFRGLGVRGLGFRGLGFVKTCLRCLDDKASNVQIYPANVAHAPCKAP